MSLVSRRDPRPSRLCSALLAAGLIATFASPALAQSSDTAALTATYRFDIPAQPLADALRSYMRQSGVQVAYPAALAAGVTSNPVNAELDAQSALAQLLLGSGLGVRQVGNGAVTLERAPQGARADGVTVTQPLRVAGGYDGWVSAEYFPRGTTAEGLGWITGLT